MMTFALKPSRNRYLWRAPHLGRLLKKVLQICCCDLASDTGGQPDESSSQSSVVSTASSHSPWQDDVEGNEQLKMTFVPRCGLIGTRDLVRLMQTQRKIAEVCMIVWPGYQWIRNFKCNGTKVMMKPMHQYIIKKFQNEYFAEYERELCETALGECDIRSVTTIIIMTARHQYCINVKTC